MHWFHILGSITAGLTAFYSFRLISLVFLTVPNAPRVTYLNTHEAKLAVIVPLFLLAVFSIFGSTNWFCVFRLVSHL